jgi:hypothetical protein
MSEPTPLEDPLERELTGMSPVQPSGALRGRIAATLTPPARREARHRTVVWRSGAAKMAIAACLAVALFLWARSVYPPAIVDVPSRPHTRPSELATVAPSPPTLGALRLALARSPEAAVALLSGGGAAKEGPDETPRAFGAGASHAWPTY